MPRAQRAHTVLCLLSTGADVFVRLFHVPSLCTMQVRYDNSHFDTRSDFVSNEVALEYNAGWTAALAGLIALRA